MVRTFETSKSAVSHLLQQGGTVPNPSQTNRGPFSFKPQSVILNKVVCTSSPCLSFCELLRHVSSYFLSIKKSQVICSLSIELFKIHYIYFLSDVCFASIFSHSVNWIKLLLYSVNWVLCCTAFEFAVQTFSDSWNPTFLKKLK